VLDHGDAVALDSLIASSAVIIHGSGRVSTETQRLADHRAGRVKTVSATREILHVQSFGDDFAMVLVRAQGEGESHGRKWDSSAVMVFGFARTAGGPWQVVYYQTVPEKAT